MPVYERWCYKCGKEFDRVDTVTLGSHSQHKRYFCFACGEILERSYKLHPPSLPIAEALAALDSDS